MSAVGQMPTCGFPLVGIERGYFLDIQWFFGEKKLLGFKILSAACNLKCYYCHRKQFLNRELPRLSHDQMLAEIEKWAPYNIATFTGGEITLVAEETAALMETLKNRGAIAVFSTNGILGDKVDYLTKHANVVKIDIKASKRHYEKVTGLAAYPRVIESVGICTSRLATEVKLILHSFTEKRDVETMLHDLKDLTGFPDNMIIEFQLVRDFLGGVLEPDAHRIREICRTARPLPETVLLKEYGTQETIDKLTDGEWRLYRKKEVPLRFDW